MRLGSARLCLNADCEELFDGPVCPKCGSENWATLAKWIPQVGRTQMNLLKNQVEEAVTDLQVSISRTSDRVAYLRANKTVIAG